LIEIRVTLEVGRREAILPRPLAFRVTCGYNQHPESERENLGLLSITGDKKVEGHANEPGAWVPLMPRRKIR
jgi:hypothetical protein